jgi:hypothetical protein
MGHEYSGFIELLCVDSDDALGRSERWAKRNAGSWSTEGIILVIVWAWLVVDALVAIPCFRSLIAPWLWLGFCRFVPCPIVIAPNTVKHVAGKHLTVRLVVG